MKKQVIYIHGGQSFNSKKEYISYLKTCRVDFLNESSEKWPKFLDKDLGEDFSVISPKMPCKQNAKFLEWKIWFERIFDVLEDDVVLVGWSLGGIFLAKYLQKYKFPKKIKALFLVAPPFWNEKGNSFNLSNNFTLLTSQVDNIYLYFSEDDFVVDFSDSLKYKKYIPGIKFKKFKRKGHFLQKDFPLLIRDIKKISK